MASLRRLLKPTVLIKRNAVLKGILGGDRKWLIMGIVVWVGGKAKSLLGFGVPKPVYLETVKQGQRLVIAHQDSSNRRKRRKARKTSKNELAS